MSAYAASAVQLKKFLMTAVEEEVTSYTLLCNNEREALNLRARLNKIRANDRREAQKLYAQEGLTMDISEGASSFDQLIFRVEGPRVLVEKTSLAQEDVGRFFFPTDAEPRDAQGLPAPQSKPAPLQATDDRRGINFLPGEKIFD